MMALLALAVFGAALGLAWWVRPPALGPRLRRQCAWCERVVELGDPGALTTHTICRPCQARFDRQTHAAPERRGVWPRQ